MRIEKWQKLVCRFLFLVAAAKRFYQGIIAVQTVEGINTVIQIQVEPSNFITIIYTQSQ